MRSQSLLTPLLLRAGAVMSQRDGQPIAAHYGSAAGELSACLCTVGLVDRSDLTLLGVSAAPPRLDDTLARLLGTEIAPGGALEVGGAWWCRPDASEALVVSGTAHGSHLRRLRAESHRSAGLTVRDRAGEHAVLGVIGRAAPELLASLGAFGAEGDPRRVAPFRSSELDGVHVRWVLQADDSALAIVEARDARSAWESIGRHGARHGISHVGVEAADRFSLLARRSACAVPSGARDAPRRHL